MRESLALPLILAAVFTAGCIVIQQFEQRTAYAEDVLIGAFVIVAGLATIALLGRYADGAHAFQRSPPKQVQISDAPPSSRPGLTGLIWRPPRFRQPCC